MKIAITGPTGNIGRELVKILLAKGGHELILLARNPDKLKKESAQGAQIKSGDLKEESFYQEATKGADVLFHLSPPNVKSGDMRKEYQQYALNAANAIKTNKIKRVVVLSSVGAEKSERTGPVLGLHDVEEILNKTGVAVTHLRPAYFLENFLNSIPTIQEAGSIFLPLSGSTRIPMIATKDIAQAAANVLTDTGWSGQRVIELLGAAEVSFDEVAAEIGKALGKEVKHIKVDNEQALQAMAGMGLSESFAKSLVELDNNLESGWLKPTQSRTPQTTTPTTLAQFVSGVLAPAIQAGSPVAP